MRVRRADRGILPGDRRGKYSACLGYLRGRLWGDPSTGSEARTVVRVKVGKSTFASALLGEDLAKNGTTEDTNYFTYG